MFSTDAIVTAVASFFTEDPSAFEGYKFYTRIAEGAEAPSIGRAALEFLEDETEAFAVRMGSNIAADPWSLTELLDNIIKAFPAELLPALGAKLAQGFVGYV